jgi:hypothetical protein
MSIENSKVRIIAQFLIKDWEYFIGVLIMPPFIFEFLALPPVGN